MRRAAFIFALISLLMLPACSNGGGEAKPGKAAELPLLIVFESGGRFEGKLYTFCSSGSLTLTGTAYSSDSLAGALPKFWSLPGRFIFNDSAALPDELSEGVTAESALRKQYFGIDTYIDGDRLIFPGGSFAPDGDVSALGTPVYARADGGTVTLIYYDLSGLDAGKLEIIARRSDISGKNAGDVRFPVEEKYTVNAAVFANAVCFGDRLCLSAWDTVLECDLGSGTVRAMSDRRDVFLKLVPGGRFTNAAGDDLPVWVHFCPGGELVISAGLLDPDGSSHDVWLFERDGEIIGALELSGGALTLYDASLKPSDSGLAGVRQIRFPEP